MVQRSTLQRFIAGGGKPRRASAEVALRMHPRPRMGDRITYYILPRQKGQSSDWQRANALSDYDPLRLPYDPKYYLKKLEDWVARYDSFIEVTKPVPTEQQGELL